jgi:uncharacterized protein YfiM (DUF2279 family)
MSEQSLQDILKAEKEAADKLRKAQQDADSIRKSSTGKAAAVEAAAAATIESDRREAMTRLERDIESARIEAAADSRNTCAEWDRRHKERREAIISKLCDVISGKA